MAFVAEVIPQEDLSKFIDNPVWHKLSYGRDQITPGFSRWVVDEERDMFVKRSSGDRTTDVFAMHLQGEFVKFRTHVRATQIDNQEDIYSVLWYVYEIEIPSDLEIKRTDILKWIEEFCAAAGGTSFKGPEKYSEIKVLFTAPPFELTIY